MTDSRRGTTAPGFEDLFGRRADLTASAPGRVNLIGEHTDYNGGYVLPTVIPQRTTAQLARRDDHRVRAWSDSVDHAVVEYALGAEAPRHDWIDYVQGITRVLRDMGHRLQGFDLRLSSTVPVGSGLSSSAALEISLLRALSAAFDLSIEDVAMARAGQRAENEFVGAPVGIMDQMACNVAGDREALFLDTRTMAYERVPLPDGVELVVINSGIAHRHASGDYRTRRAECERAAEMLGVPQLRDLSLSDLPRVMSLPDPLGRRARHVVTEDVRVLETVAALRAGDVRRIGELFDASHASMRDDYQVSIPEVDHLVELAGREPEVHGARLTGGGFGGSIVALVDRGAGSRVAARVAEAYAGETGETPTVLVPPKD